MGLLGGVCEMTRLTDKEGRIMSALCRASVDNPLLLPLDHPAILTSLSHLEKLCARTRAARKDLA
jgi:hypothetical protein